MIDRLDVVNAGALARRAAYLLRFETPSGLRAPRTGVAPTTNASFVFVRRARSRCVPTHIGASVGVLVRSTTTPAAAATTRATSAFWFDNSAAAAPPTAERCVAAQANLPLALGDVVFLDRNGNGRQVRVCARAPTTTDRPIVRRRMPRIC